MRSSAWHGTARHGVVRRGACGRIGPRAFPRGQGPVGRAGLLRRGRAGLGRAGRGWGGALPPLVPFLPPSLPRQPVTKQLRLSLPARCGALSGLAGWAQSVPVPAGPGGLCPVTVRPVSPNAPVCLVTGIPQLHPGPGLSKPAGSLPCNPFAWPAGERRKERSLGQLLVFDQVDNTNGNRDFSAVDLIPKGICQAAAETLANSLLFTYNTGGCAPPHPMALGSEGARYCCVFHQGVFNLSLTFVTWDLYAGSA